MSDTKKPRLDDAHTGGGIGDIDRQPVDPSTENSGEADPVIEADEEERLPLVTDEDPQPSGDDPDDEADEILGTIV